MTYLAFMSGHKEATNLIKYNQPKGKKERKEGKRKERKKKGKSKETNKNRPHKNMETFMRI